VEGSGGREGEGKGRRREGKGRERFLLGLLKALIPPPAQVY